jgi:ADP-heptose:LPS heptosyltransferase
MGRSWRNILVCRTDAIGDSLMTLPVVTALKKALPHTRVTFLASMYAADIIENQAGVDEVWRYDRSGEHRGITGRRTLSRRIAQAEFDAALLVFPDRRVSWAIFTAGVPCRVGTGRRWWSFLYTHPVRVSRAQGGRHEADYNLDLVRRMGLHAELEAPRLLLEPDAVVWAKSFLHRSDDAAESWVAVHPGGHGSAANWPPMRYRALVQRLVTFPGVKVLLTGSPAEREILAEAAAGCSPGPLVVEQSISLKQLAALLSQVNVFVSGNTGPMHIAAGVGTPTVSFFPPAGVTGPGRWRPLGNTSILLSPPDHGGNVNMLDVSVEQAEQSIAGLLKKM